MMSTLNGQPIVYRAEGVERHFGGVAALGGVDFHLRSGEIHGLLGANGAGKSTLVRILAGADRPSRGRVKLHERYVTFQNVQQANDSGIAFVSQELNLFPDLTGLQNLFLSREPRVCGVAISRRAMRSQARRVVAEVGITFDLDRPVRSLNLAERQLLEIARALLADPAIVILDEPTSALQASETERLLTVLEGLRDKGRAIVFVSHFLEDTFRVAERVTILRGGRSVVSDKKVDELSIKDAIREMLGREAWERSQVLMEKASSHRSASVAADGHRVTFDGVWCGQKLKDVSFEASRGSVTGLAGLEGSGARAVLEVLFGVQPLDRGTVTLPDGRPGPRSIPEAVKSGIAFVPADRKSTGLMLRKSIAENVVIVSAGPLKRLGWVLGRRKLKSRTEFWRRRLGIQMGSYGDSVDSLSGGNQQKVVFAKWLEAEPEIILFDDPTRGVDVGAKLAMQELIRDAAEHRVILYASTDFEEMAEVCDRILVFFAGRLIAELETGITEHRLLEIVNEGKAADALGSL